MGAHAVRLSNVDIDNALKNRDFEVLFQPIFDLANGALARMETFVRWRHPSLGLLPPGAFISFFETQGRMSELTRYVLAEALDAYIGWRGPFAPGFSINLALSDLADEAFASHFTVLLRERGFPPELVTLECPMPPVTMEVEHAAAQFRRLSTTGARLAIEVRGRANDFLRLVDPFPFHEIKTGGAAILRFARTVRGPGLSAISELLELANAQNAAITAVGVEDQASLAALRGLGFAAAQGNHLGGVGELSAFTPSRVNEVRALLELEPLSREDLAALFRTGAPDIATRAAERAAAEGATAADGGPGKGELVDRLTARLNRDQERKPQAAPADDSESREERKAAAIARAKKRAADAARLAALRARSDAARKAATEGSDAPPRDDAIPDDAPNASPASGWAHNRKVRAAPHELQERLSREFEAFADDLMPTSEGSTTASAPAIESAGETPPEGPGIKAAAPDATESDDFEFSSSSSVDAADETPDDAPREAEEPAVTADPLVATESTGPARAPAFTSAVRETEASPDTGAQTAEHPGVAARTNDPARHNDETVAAADVVSGLGAAAADNAAMTAAPSQGAFAFTLFDQAASVDAFPKRSILVRGVPARFLPTLRVQGADLGETPDDADATPRETSLEGMATAGPRPAVVPKPPAPAPAAEKVERTDDAPARSVFGRAAPRGDLDETPDDDLPPAAAPVEAQSAQAAPARLRRKKPFLQRTVIPMSGYFWPRSWRRAWKRRRAEARRREAAHKEFAE